MKGDTTRGLDEDPPEPALPLFGKRVPAACSRCGLGGDEHDLVNHRCPTDGLTAAERASREIGETAANNRFGAKGGNCFNDVEVPPLDGGAAVRLIIDAIESGDHHVVVEPARCPDCLLRASTPVTPLSDVLFVRPDPLPGVSSGGIFLPDDPRVNKAVWHGVVLAAGPGFLGANGRRRELQVRVGERVVFPRYSAHEVKGVPGHGTVWSVLERDVLATCGVDVVLTDAVVHALPQGR